MFHFSYFDPDEILSMISGDKNDKINFWENIEVDTIIRLCTILPTIMVLYKIRN